MSNSDLTVIIPTRDRWQILDKTVQALQPQMNGAELLIVVDGLDQKVPHIRGATVEIVERGGPGKARNAGVERSSRPLILFLGDDMVPGPGLLAAHVRRHREEPAEQIAVLGSVRWYGGLGRKPIHRWIDRSSVQFDFASIPEGSDAGWGRFYSCNVSLKRSLFSAAGGFDPDFVYYYEDLDMGWKLDQAGMTLRYEPDALARHLHPYDLARLKSRFEGIARGEWMMSRKHPWFEPYFSARFLDSQRQRPESRNWQVLDRIPVPNPLRSRVRRHADTWYMQQLAQRFLEVWQGEQDLTELREYLGDRFDEATFYNHHEAVDAEEASAPDERTFYRNSEAYLYDLTAFASWGTKTPYRAELRRHVSPGARLLDYGCGIGSDGLRLVDDGYEVAFADYDSPSTRYLRWRLQRRGLDLPVYDIESQVPGGFDAAYSFDVIEHVEDPFAFLAELEQRARIVAVNLLEPDDGDTHLHKPLPIVELIAHAKKHRLLHNRIYHGRSHLLIYELR